MERMKLGVALAGGGFRAALFHLGVLRRMAELDLLRHMEVLSTVSGGSIVGALYVLLLKRHLEAPPHHGKGPEALRLPPEEYHQIIDELQHRLVAAVQLNLRTRLFMNPWKLLKVALLSDTLATAMARLYEQHLFADVVAQLRHQGWRDAAGLRPGCIAITALRLRPNEVDQAHGSEEYNYQALLASNDAGRGGPGSAVTRLIVNATSLNSGARFWFSHAEFGDWYSGHVRTDEFPLLLSRKILLDLPPGALARLVNELAALPAPAADLRWGNVAQAVMRSRHWLQPSAKRPAPALPGVPAQRLALWWPERTRHPVADAALALPWNALTVTEGLEGLNLDALARQLAAAEPGRLRAAKNSAWYLDEGRFLPREVSAWLDPEAVWMRLFEALKVIDEPAAVRLERLHAASPERAGPPQARIPEHAVRRVSSERGVSGAADLAPWRKGLLRLVIEIHHLRSALAMSPGVQADWQTLPLAQVVAASAAFPPLFSPLRIDTLFDRLHLRTLGLTDGGVFDNLGTTALLDEQCDIVIASDPGGVFDTRAQDSSVGRWRMSGRLVGILSERPLALYRHDLQERARMGRAMADQSPQAPVAGPGLRQFAATRSLQALAFLRIDAEALPPVPDERNTGVQPALAAGVPAALAAGLRTDLDAFGDIEIKALVNQGYLLADTQLREQLKGTPLDPAMRAPAGGHQAPAVGSPAGEPWAPATRLPMPVQASADRVARVLAVGRSSFGRALALREAVSTSLTVLAAVALVGGIWWFHLDWAHVRSGVTWLLLQGLQLLLDTGLSWVSPLLDRVPLRYAALGALVAAGLALVMPRRGTGPLRALRRRLGEPNARQALTLLQKALIGLKAVALTVLWLPAVVLVTCGVAAISHHVFARGFLRATRDPRGLHDSGHGHDPAPPGTA